MRLSTLAWSAILAATLVAAPLHAQVAGPFAAPEPRVARAPAGQSLAPVSGDAVADVSAYLRRAGHDDATIASLVLASRDTTGRTGVTHLRFTQRVGGLDVYGTYVKAAVGADGAVISVVENLAPARAVGGSPIAGGEGRALAIGLRHVHGGALAAPGLLRQDGNTSVFARTAFFHREPTVTRVAVPAGASLRLGYLVETWTARGNQLHHTLVGGDGAVLGDESRTASDSYLVFAIDPGKSAQQIVNGSAADPTASRNGWLFAGTQRTTSIAGNNVSAYLDVDANNAADAGGSTVTDGNFLTVFDVNAQPGTTTNKAVATQNLFYLNNVVHDALYRHGFTEAAGNFQEDNFGLGGAGSDSVNAEVQDGSGTDNANFSTPADGSNPRMQMYIWSAPGDTQVVIGAAVYTAQNSTFTPLPPTTGITGPLAPAGDACSRFTRNALAGTVAIIDRGTCNFDAKISNAARAGALAAIVVNNVDTGIFAMGGSTASKIPAVMVSLADGAPIKASAGLSGTVRAATPAPINRDSSLDADIVAHEYGHGLTWRMIGGMSGPMSGAIGEGMSDVLSLLFYNDPSQYSVSDDDVVGEYSAFSPAGIRTQPYDTYSLTYGDLTWTEVHLDGELYGAIGYRLRRNFLQDASPSLPALTTADLLDHVVDGMNFTPSSPKYEDMRDGILASISGDASLSTGDKARRSCLVWDAFADFGVGVGAQATVKRSGRVTVVESAAIPDTCTAVP